MRLMETNEPVRDIELRVGRRESDGVIELSAALPRLLTLRVSSHGERAANVVLTREQVRQLRHALARIEPLIEGDAPARSAGGWDGYERRAPSA